MAITTAMIKELREMTGAGILDSKKALELTDGNIEKAIEHLREKGLAKAAKKANRAANDGLVSVRVDGKEACMVEVNCETDFVARTDAFQSFVDSVSQQVQQDPGLTTLDALLQADFIGNPGKSVADSIQETISKLGENIVVRQLARYTRSGPGVIEGYVHMGGRIGVLVELGVSDESAQGDGLNDLAHDLTLQIAAVSPNYLNREAVPADVLENERNILMAQLSEEKKPDNIKAKIVEGRINKFYQENCLLDQAFVKDDSLSITQLIRQIGKTLGTTITLNRFTRFELGVN